MLPERPANRSPRAATLKEAQGHKPTATQARAVVDRKLVVATDKDGDLPGKPEKSERALMKVMRRCQKPIALSIDAGHNLPAQMLRSLKQYVTRVLEQAYRFGEKPVTPAIVHMTLAPDLHDLEPTLTRYGYNVTALSELLNLRQADVRAFLRGQLPPGRTEELHNQLLATGIPLHDHATAAGHQSAAGEA